MDKISSCQDRVLKLLAGELEGFYLAGGTALSRVYFQHRKSYDLDFFTRDYSSGRISKIVEYLSKKLNRKIPLITEQNKKGLARVSAYGINLTKTDTLKIDFIEDLFELLKPLKTVDAIAVLSLEDIYLRKLFAVIGNIETEDLIGRKSLKGGREDAKDFFDLYLLSHTFMRLSEFATRYCNPAKIEGVIRWFRTYNRMGIKTGLLDIVTDKRIEYKDMESHFKDEVDELVKREIGLK